MQIQTHLGATRFLHNRKRVVAIVAIVILGVLGLISLARNLERNSILKRFAVQLNTRENWNSIRYKLYCDVMRQDKSVVAVTTELQALAFEVKANNIYFPNTYGELPSIAVLNIDSNNKIRSVTLLILDDRGILPNIGPQEYTYEVVDCARLPH